MSWHTSQRIFATPEGNTSILQFQGSCNGIWDPANARFSACALPYLSAVPGIIIIFVVFAHLLHLIPLFKRWRPNWTKPFVQELREEQAKLLLKREIHTLAWSIGLLCLSSLAFAAQVVKFKFVELRLHAILLLLAWTAAFLYIALVRPRSCPTSLLAFYIPALVVEFSLLDFCRFPATLEGATHYVAGSAAAFSIVIVMVMPFRPASLLSDSIGAVGSAPNNSLRSPEDNLRLWQFLCISWISPLIAVGAKRQLHEEDIWGLGFEFQHTRLHENFRQLKGSVLNRLLQANGIDCCILVFISLIQLLCGLVAPFLLQQLLQAMEGQTPLKMVALVYAILSLIIRLISAQLAMLAMWYGRRCYERSRGEMIMMVYEKALSRKLVVSFEQTDGPGSCEAANGNESANGSFPKPKTNRRHFYQFLKDTILRRGHSVSKLKQPATTGKILNLIRGDIYEVAQRFFETEGLIKTLFGLPLAVGLIWRFLGPSCFFGVLALVVAQVLNGVLTRILTRWMRIRKLATDARIQLNSQYVEVLRHLRWYGWQQHWLRRVLDARQHELNVRVITNMLGILIRIISTTAGYIFPVAAFYAYTAFAGHTLRIDIIFPALQLFTILQARLQEMPSLVDTLLNAYVALGRIEEFMSEPEKVEISSSSSSLSTIKLDESSFAWPGQSTPVLRSVTLEIEKGLTVIYGKVGAGKTALLQAFLGELDQVGGVSEIPNEMMAYCSQAPWLQSMSIRDNIIFFSPYVEDRYKNVLEACALLPDLAKFQHADRSLIGENGIGLSGGQKARVALARAIYSRSNILLLDDPLSALDHNTAELIVRKCFSGPLMLNRTIVLVTHRTNLVRHLATRFIEVVDGEVSVSSNETLWKNAAVASADEDPDSESAPSLRQPEESVAPSKFIEDEQREYGGVKSYVFWTYLKSGKLRWWALMAISISVVRIFNITIAWVFKAWGEAYGEDMQYFGLIGWAEYQRQAKSAFSGGSSLTRTSISLDPIHYLPNPADNVQPWLLLLFILSILQSITLFTYHTIQLYVVYCTAKNLFRQVMERITNATFRFYDITPIGRLMNRLTSDVQSVDMAIRYLGPLIFHWTAWISSFIVITLITPVFLVFSIGLMGGFVVIFLRFLPTSQSLRRLQTVSLSPLFANFGELLTFGLPTIRAFHAQQLFQKRVIQIVDTFQSNDHFYWSLQNWLMYRFETLSAVSTFVLTAIALYTDLSPGLIAFTLINSSVFVQTTHLLCRRYGDMQMDFVAVERVVELIGIEQEPSGNLHPPASWPKFGSDVVFENVTIRYAEHLDPALVDISLRIPGGSTTAIVGRTGSGKSTLAAALLNIVRPDLGVVTIDNVNLAEVDTATLRQRVTFVAQEPVLFSGTIRHNLDPTHDYTDEECAVVLERICVRQGWTLQTNIESGGCNLSQGQRQLIGITRAVLRRSPVVVLDEATASVDFETSLEVQQILREEMKESTVITIAHRVEAVKDADYCVVLDNGRVKMQGSVEDMISG